MCCQPYQFAEEVIADLLPRTKHRSLDFRERFFDSFSFARDYNTTC
jgi:hypothetical protein